MTQRPPRAMLLDVTSWRRELIVFHAAELIRLAERYDAGTLYLTGSVACGEERDEPAPGKPEPSDLDFYTPDWRDDRATNEKRARAFLADVRALFPATTLDIRPMGPGWPIDGVYLDGFRRDAIPLTGVPCLMRSKGMVPAQLKTGPRGAPR